ncbi:MAG: PQQ-dependent sugar dehydrogenase [Pseudomonadales bacterium]
MQLAKFFIQLAFLLSLAACGGGGSGGNSNAPTMPEATFGLEQRESLSPPQFSVRQDLSGVAISNAFPNLAFTDPVMLVFATALPGTDRLVAVQQRGLISSFVNNPSVASAELFLDISDRVQSGGEEGLLGLAFAPDYESSGQLYVYYSTSGPRRSVIARYTRDASNPLRADPGSEQVLLEVEQPFSNHNAGMLAFGPDGMLYIALGDGGSGGDPLNHGQNTETLLGSLLRIDVSSGAYTIPADNPFINDSNARSEIWAYGLRNPYRFSFDRLTGDLWAGDVGQNDFEEIDIIQRGGNYGWRVLEGDSPFDDSANTLPQSAFTSPVLVYGRSEGNSVTGGYVYRGNSTTDLQGRYVYGDFGRGTVWALDYDGQRVISNQTIGNVNSLSSFAEDASGEIFALSYSGSIFKFEQAMDGSPAVAPALLSATGLFADLGNLNPVDGLIEYDVQASYWSDNALRRRWIGVPDGQQIQFSENASWEFPLGTVIVQQIDIELTSDDPSSARRLETRVLVNTDRGWRGFTYRWNAEQTDANRLDTSSDETLVITDSGASSGQRNQQYHYPSESECIRCHNTNATSVLGLNTRQLNGDFDYAARTDNQLRSFDHITLFDQTIADADSLPSMPDPFDAAAPLEARAKAYLDTNCAHCHQPGGPTPSQMDLRFTTAVADMNVLDQTALNEAADSTVRLITAGDTANSELWLRMQGQSGGRMPPLGSNLVDTDGVVLIAEWIDGL